MEGTGKEEASSIAQWVKKNLPAMQETQETWVRSLGWEDPLEEEMATHFSILAWRIPWTEESGKRKVSQVTPRYQLVQLGE